MKRKVGGRGKGGRNGGRQLPGATVKFVPERK